MSMDIERVQEVLGPGGPQPMVEERIPVLPIPAALAASAGDEVEEDATGAAVEPAPTGRSSSRVRKAVAMFDPSPAKKARVEPPSLPIPTGAQGAALERIRTNQVGSRSYLAANEILLPIAMREYPPDANSLLAVDRTSLDAFFTKGLTDVCESVFGPRLTKRLAVEFTSKTDTPSIRNFFELMNAGPQCIGVLSEQPPGAILEHCWICGTKTTPEDGAKECEHKFSILPALVVTGLYDSRLRKALGENGLKVYQPQLVSEYAYAHRRCNQVKSDVVFASLRYEGNNPRIVQCGTNPTAVQATLNDSLTRAATTYTPQPDALRAKFQAGPLWDGLSPTATDPATPDDASWIIARTQRVGQSMMAAAAKFNSKRLPAFVVKTHIVNAMLTRAIELSPQLVGEELWDSLTPEGQARVTRSLAAGGGRRKTRRSRKGTRRAMRGGEGDADIWIDLVSSRIKEARLKTLATALETAFKDVTTPEDYNAKVMEVFADHVAKTDMEINDALGTMTAETLATFLPTEGDGASGPMRRTISAVRMSGPLPPPVNTAPPSGTLASTQGFDEAEESASGSDSQMSRGFASPPRNTSKASPQGSPSGTPPPRPTGSASEFGSIVSPPAKPPGPRGGFTFTLGTRPDWL